MQTESSRFTSAYLLDGKGGAQQLNESEVEAWHQSNGTLWIDLDLTNEHARQWLENDSGLNRNVYDILLAGDTRPRALIEENGLVIILRGINLNPGAVPDDMVAVRIWIEGNRIITSYRRKLLSTSDVKEALDCGNGPRRVGEFLNSFLAYLAIRIDDAIENIEQIVADCGSRIARGDISDLRVQLGSVRRQAAAVRRHLAPQRDTLNRLVRVPVTIFSKNEMFDLREEADKFTRLLEDLDLAREGALVTQEELTSRIAEAQNSRMYLLSVVAAIFLPLTFVTGMLGMNVAGLPGVENPNGFVFSAIAMVVLGVCLITYFKWKKWI